MEIDNESARPVYAITVASSLTNTTPRMLREYENAGFIKPARVNSQRRYSHNDIQFIKNIKFYLDEVGMTITGLKLLYMMTPCWGIKQCGQTECPAYHNYAQKCWEAIKGCGEADGRTCMGCPIYLTFHKNRGMKLHQGKDIGPRCFTPPEKKRRR
jgi:MerR family transcriptional regulator/heat shock protein HspR